MAVQVVDKELTMRHVVIGAGEVGEAIYNVLSEKHEVYLRDITPEGPSQADVLHICFPYSYNFMDATRG